MRHEFRAIYGGSSMAFIHLVIEMVFKYDGFVSMAAVPFSSSIRPVSETQIIQNIYINA